MIRINADLNLLASVSGFIIILWEYEKLRLKGACCQHKTIVSIEFVKFYAVLASLDNSGRIYLWDL